MPDDRAGFLRVCDTWLIEGKVCNKRRVLGHAAENRRHVLDGCVATARTRYRRSGMASPRVFWRGARRSCGSLSDSTRCPAVEWSITRFLTWAAVLNYRSSARGLRFTVSFRIGAVFPGGRKTADFLGDRSSVRVVSGSGTATLKCGRRPAGIHRNRSAAQKFFHR